MSEAKLNSDARAVLDRCDMVAHPADEGGFCRVYDEDGRWLFNVSTGINHTDLMQLLMHGDRMRRLGIDIGAAGVRASLRELIGAAPLEPLE